jgi:hypothetical protein
MRNYYTLTSTVIECVKYGTLSAQKLEELKLDFYSNSDGADAIDTQREDSYADQEDGTTEVDFP